jgi:spore germination protein GerM
MKKIILYIVVAAVTCFIGVATWSILQPHETPPAQSTKVFFGNSVLDPEASCVKVFPVARSIMKTETVGKASLEEMLKGPTPEEKMQGYFTSIGEGVTVQKLAIKNDTAYADFNDALERSAGGSCRVSAIRSQIAETLKQFPTVKNVVISINGKTEDILQP